MEVDGIAGAPDGADQGEGEDADEETQQGQGQAHPGDQLQLECVLEGGIEAKTRHHIITAVEAAEGRMAHDNGRNGVNGMEWNQTHENHLFDVFDTIPPIPLQPLS